MKHKHFNFLAAFLITTAIAAGFFSGPFVLSSAERVSKGSPLSTLRVSGIAWLEHVRDGVVIDRRGPFKNLIVNAGETALRDCFGGTGTPSCTVVQNFKFHGIGEGTTAAAEANTSCETELTTEYSTDNVRATGSQTNNGANIYRTVGTNTVDGAAAVTEFCLMSDADVGEGTMWTRIVFSAINLANGDSLQTTYDLTIE